MLITTVIPILKHEEVKFSDVFTHLKAQISVTYRYFLKIYVWALCLYVCLTLHEFLVFTESEKCIGFSGTGVSDEC